MQGGGKPEYSVPASQEQPGSWNTEGAPRRRSEEPRGVRSEPAGVGLLSFQEELLPPAPQMGRLDTVSSPARLLIRPQLLVQAPASSAHPSDGVSAPPGGSPRLLSGSLVKANVRLLNYSPLLPSAPTPRFRTFPRESQGLSNSRETARDSSQEGTDGLALRNPSYNSPHAQRLGGKVDSLHRGCKSLYENRHLELPHLGRRRGVGGHFSLLLLLGTAKTPEYNQTYRASLVLQRLRLRDASAGGGGTRVQSLSGK